VRLREDATGHDSAVIQIRPLTVEDAEPLVDLLRSNREFLAPWQPIQDPELFTLGGSARRSRGSLTTSSMG